MARSSTLPARTTLPTRTTWPFTRFADWPEFGLISNLMHAAGSELIRVEEFVEDKTLVVRAELPGIDPDKDVEVTTSPGMLHIDVTREAKAEYTGHEGFRTEFRYGSFSRSITLPTGTYESEVKATYDNGILEVRVPITKSTAHKIEVKHS